MRFEIEQDGPRYRWVLLSSDGNRVAKGAQWWNTEFQAQEASDRFSELMQEYRDTVDGDT